MKTKTILFLLAFFALIFSCKEDEKVVDPIYEFIAFVDESPYNVNEFTNSTAPVPIVAQLLAFKPYSEDIDLTLELTATNAQSGVDFTVTPSNSIKIRAGKFTSDTVWVETIDNQTQDLARGFEVKIVSSSKSEIKIGLGLEAKSKASVTFAIVDDECTNTAAIYESSLNNTLAWGYVLDTWDQTDVALSATGSVNTDVVTVAGDLLYYDGLFTGNIAVPFTLTPEFVGATRGTATFGGTLDLGMATDGYTYRLVEVGVGSYDVCSKTITTKFTLQYDDSGSWVDYYSVSSVYAVP